MRRAQMKRAIFEWGAIAASIISLTCFIYWGVSISTHMADFAASLSGRMVGVSASGGSITARNPQNELIEDPEGALQVIESIYTAVPFNPRFSKPVSRYGCDIPGLKFRHITSARDATKWMVRVSLLIPATISLVAALLLIRGYRQILTASAALSEIKNREAAHSLN